MKCDGAEAKNGQQRGLGRGLSPSHGVTVETGWLRQVVLTLVRGGTRSSHSCVNPCWTCAALEKRDSCRVLPVKVCLWSGIQLAVPEIGETNSAVLKNNLCGSSKSTPWVAQIHLVQINPGNLLGNASATAADLHLFPPLLFILGPYLWIVSLLVYVDLLAEWPSSLKAVSPGHHALFRLLLMYLSIIIRIAQGSTRCLGELVGWETHSVRHSLCNSCPWWSGSEIPAGWLFLASWYLRTWSMKWPGSSCSLTFGEAFPTEPMSEDRKYRFFKLLGAMVSEATHTVSLSHFYCDSNSWHFNRHIWKNEAFGLDDQFPTFFPLLLICNSPYALRLFIIQKLWTYVQIYIKRTVNALFAVNIPLKMKPFWGCRYFKSH